mgnify:CR=1 FL=1
MPNHFLQSIVIPTQTLAVSTTVTFDLPINPLSHIYLTIRLLNNTGTAALTLNYTTLAQLLATITRVEVLFRGSAIISASLTDIAVAYMILTGRQIWGGQLDHIDDNVRQITIPIPLGRLLYNRSECFPATRKGELQLQITSGAAVAGIDTLTIQAETVELIDANPQAYLKLTTATKDPGGVQEEDLDLPIGNIVAGVLIFSTTPPAGAAATIGINNIQMLVNNVQRYYPRTNWETLHGALTQRLDPLVLNSHVHAIHRTTAAGLAASAVSIADGVAGAVTGGVAATGAATNLIAATSGILQQSYVADFMENYALLDLDPTRDLTYALDTLGLSRFHLRISHGIDEVIRAIPFEIVRV